MLTINIGISHCLLGAQVRYDGKGKRSSICSSFLANDYNLLPICPEVEAGLSIPRPAVELVQYPHEIKALGRDDNLVDVTSTLRQFCATQVPQLTDLSGFILTPRSPSCGLNTVPIKSPHGQLLNANGRGIFAELLVDHYPSLPVIEEPELAKKKHFACSNYR